MRGITDRGLHAVLRWCKRIGWLAVYWLLGVAALGVIALFLKAVMRMVGLGA